MSFSPLLGAQDGILIPPPSSPFHTWRKSHKPNNLGFLKSSPPCNPLADQTTEFGALAPTTSAIKLPPLQLGFASPAPFIALMRGLHCFCPSAARKPLFFFTWQRYLCVSVFPSSSFRSRCHYPSLPRTKSLSCLKSPFFLPPPPLSTDCSCVSRSSSKVTLLVGAGTPVFSF